MDVQGIEEDVKRGILEKVLPGVPDTWCTRMVITAKKDGSPRRTVDLAALTKAGVRETHHTRSPFNVVASLSQLGTVRMATMVYRWTRQIGIRGRL